VILIVNSTFIKPKPFFFNYSTKLIDQFTFITSFAAQRAAIFATGKILIIYLR